MKDGKITQIPAQKQKRWIVFEQILNEFEFGKEYAEKEVNEIIQKYNVDYCSIRRSFNRRECNEQTRLCLFSHRKIMINFRRVKIRKSNQAWYERKL